MKKLFIVAFAALGMLACSEGGKNTPDPVNPATNGGVLSGKFSVSATTQVQFSQGNLQYQASTKTWRFAENQYDAIKDANMNISDTYSGWIDLFGWGTGNNPQRASEDNNDYKYFTDWGVNAISNGGNKTNQWRTLTSDEWVYLFRSRYNAEKLFSLGIVNGTRGLIILPDNWTTPTGLVFNASTASGLIWWESNSEYYDEQKSHWNDNVYTVNEWSMMETAGAVFLPVAGYRKGTEKYYGNDGHYWSSTKKDANIAHNIHFYTNLITPKSTAYHYSGISVRLVQDVK